MTRPVLATRTAFARATLDKVERLLEVLAALREDPILGDAFVLYGGTALNVFLDHLPRLSVDIDLMYAGSPDLHGMRGQRPIIDARLREVVGKLGYTAKSMNDEHSGQTYRLRYGDDYLKIDVSYLARVPLLEPQEIACAAAEPRVAFPVLDLRELIAGKVKALMEREAARDLYDLARLGRRDPKRLDDPLARALVVRAVSSADTFPAISGPAEALDKFAYPSDDVIEPLRAMLEADDEPDVAEMRGHVARLLAPLSQSTANESEYLRLLGQEACDRPELLFESWPDVLERARRDPVMQWKVVSLKKRPHG